MASQTAAPSSRNRYMGRGSWYFGRFTDAGVFVGYRHLGNAPEATLTPNIQKLINKSSMHADSRVLDEIVTDQEWAVSVSTQEMNQANLGLVLFGEESAYTQLIATAASVTLVDTADGGLTLGYTYQLGRRNVTTLVVSDEAGAGTLNEDYTVNLTAGTVTIPTTSGFTAGDTLTATVTAPAITGTTVPMIKGGTKTSIQGKLMFIADPAYGPATEFYAHKASVSPSDALALIQGNTLQSMRLNFTLLDDSAMEYGGTASDPVFHFIQP